MCYDLLTKPLELMVLYLPKHDDKFQRSNLSRATEIEWARSLLSECLFVLARGLFTIGNSNAITLADISSPLPVGLKSGEGRLKAHLALTAGPGLELLPGTDGFECKARPDP